MKISTLSSFFASLLMVFFANSQSLTDTLHIQKTLKLVPSLLISKPDSALHLLKVSLDLAKNLNRKKDILMHYKFIAICNAQKSDFAIGEKICKNAIEYYDSSMNPLLLGDLYNNLAIMQMRQLDYKNSVVSFEKALEIARSINDENLQIKIKFNLSTLYAKIRNYDLSIQTNNELLSIFTSKVKIDSNFIGNIYRNLGTAYFEKGNLEKSKHFFDKAYAIHKSKNFIDGLLEETGFFGEYCKIKKDYSNAIKWFENNLEICRPTSNYFILVKSHFSLGKVYFELKDYNQALIYIDSSILLSSKYNNLEDLSKANKFKGQILLTLNNLKQASLILLQNDLLNKEINKKTDIKNVQELATKYQVKEKDAKLKEQRKVIIKNNVKSNIFLFIGLFTTLLTIIFSVLFYRISKQNKIIEFQKQEIFHNNSNSFRLLINIFNNQSASNNLKSENQERIQALSLLNRMLYENGGKTTANINVYLPALCNAKKIATDNKVDIQVTSTNITLGFNQLKDIGLIVNELTMNAIKYAFDQIEKPIVSINVIERENNIYLTVHDNGNGINDKQIESSKSFGLKFVKQLVKQYDGTINTSNEQGAKFQIVMKKIATQFG